MATQMKCSGCGEMKDYALMRKVHPGQNPTQCNACALIKRKIREARNKAKWLLEKSQPKEKVVAVVKDDVVPARTFKFTPYVPEKVWTRNNGNVHIPSRGFNC